MQRLAAGVRLRWRVARHRGTAVWCPVCDHEFSRFMNDWNRVGALCWRCGSHERHRAQWLLLEHRPALLGNAGKLLHFAPEYALGQRLRTSAAQHGFAYVTGDLDPAGVDLVLDLTGLQLDDASFDAVICSHVLEHVEDDATALAELRRVTAPGGWCLIMVPLDVERTQTLEDPAVTTPQQRKETYWQEDHVRLYGPDIVDAITAAGFAVEVLRPQDAFGEVLAQRCGLLESDWMMLCS